MSLTSMLFLLVFLPAILAIYYMVKDEAKEYVLLGISLLFYALGSLRYMVLFSIAIVVTVFIGRLLVAVKQKKIRSGLLVLGIALNVGLLAYYKYTDFAIETLNTVFHRQIEARDLLLPMGISFFTFKSISYLVDVYKEKVILTGSPVRDALYLSFFAQVQSGPLTRYGEMFCEDGRRDAKYRKNLFVNGVFRFMIGFNKKVLLANMLTNVVDEVFATPISDYSTWYAWLGSICYSLQIFFDFSGYSDMAIGLSEMFGYRCAENFSYPYMTDSVGGFWKRWHISLSQWFRDYVYIPLGGSRNKCHSKVYFNLLVVWLLTGIWHGAAWNFVFWGLGYWVVISFERFTNLPNRLKTRVGKAVYRIVALVFINCQWILFRSPDIVSGLRYIKRLFIFEGNMIVSHRASFLLKDYLVFILGGILLSFPIVPWIQKKLEGKKHMQTIYESVMAIIVGLLFVWAISFVVSGHNNPFVYANF